MAVIPSVSALGFLGGQLVGDIQDGGSLRASGPELVPKEGQRFRHFLRKTSNEAL